MTSSSLEAAVTALGAWDLETAERLLKSCITSKVHVTEAHYYLGVLEILRMNETGANAYFDAYKKLPPIADDFFPLFGKFISALGPQGDMLRRVLKGSRLFPRQIAMKMSGEQIEKLVEPWYFSASGMNFFPRRVQEFDDLEALIEKYILPGHLPEKPVFTKESTLMTIGSCFAEELRSYLLEQGLRSGLMFVPPGLNNTFALRQFFEWAVTGNQSSDAYWYDEADKGGAEKWRPDWEQKAYLENVRGAAGWVFTIGLAEVWEDTETKTVFWRGIPKSLYDPSKHRCRMSTVEENADNLRRLVSLIHSVNPEAQIIFTLSPVPLKATYEDRSCFAADCVSKSTLRLAIDQITRVGLPNVAYWPSFEIVRWLGGHLPVSMFADDGNVRHVSSHAVKLILSAFLKHYFVH